MIKPDTFPRQDQRYGWWENNEAEPPRTQDPKCSPISTHYKLNSMAHASKMAFRAVMKIFRNGKATGRRSWLSSPCSRSPTSHRVHILGVQGRGCPEGVAGGPGSRSRAVPMTAQSPIAIDKQGLSHKGQQARSATITPRTARWRAICNVFERSRCICLSRE